MSSPEMSSTDTPIDNGVNVQALLDARKALSEAPEAAQFKWRAKCEWVGGTYSRSTVEGFFGLGEEQQHISQFTFDADHPEVFASEDRGATPVEIVLGVCAAEAQAAGQDGSGVCGDVADWGHDGLGRGVADESGWLGGRREGRAGVPRSFHRRDGVGHGALRRPGGCAAA